MRFAEQSGSAAVQQGAKVFSSGLRLTAGTLAGTASLVGAAYDFQDFNKSFIFKKHSIAGFYFLRASAQLSAAALSVAVGLGAAVAYFEHLSKKYGTFRILGTAINTGFKASTALAARMILMRRIFLSTNFTVLALAAVGNLSSPRRFGTLSGSLHVS